MPTPTLTKSERRSRGFGLDIDMSGVEPVVMTDFNDMTDLNDNPLLPAEKVERDRFTSSYKENTDVTQGRCPKFEE